jgi:hypothetical protein
VVDRLAVVVGGGGLGKRSEARRATVVVSRTLCVRKGEHPPEA